MARPKKVEEKQLAPAVPQPVPIAAPQQPQQQPQQPNLVGNNLQGRVIDVDNFIKVRNSVSASNPTPPALSLYDAHAHAHAHRLPPPLLSPTSPPVLPIVLLASAPTCLIPIPTTTALFTSEPPCSITAPGQGRPVFKGIFSQQPPNSTDEPSHQNCPSCTTIDSSLNDM